MPIITAFSSSGTGKTTLLVHLAYYAAAAGISTALIELDNRNSFKSCCGLPDSNFTTSDILAQGFKGDYQFLPLWESHLKGKAEVCQADYQALIETEKTLSAKSFGSLKLKRTLEKYPLFHELILLDAPGQKGIMSESAILASDYLILSVAATSKAIKDAQNFTQDLLKYDEEYGVSIPKILGIVVGEYDHDHSWTTRGIMEDLLGIAEDIGTVLFNPIRESGEFKNCWNLGLPLHLYRPGHKAVRDFDTEGNYFKTLSSSKLKDWDIKSYTSLPAIAPTVVKLSQKYA